MNDTGAIVNYLQYNSQHNWLINSLPTSFEGATDLGATFSIVGRYNERIVETETVYDYTNKFEKTNVSIASSSSAMQTVNGYKFNFAASDLTKKAMEV